MELLSYERKHLSPENSAHRMQLRQDIKEYERLITLIDIEILKGVIGVMDGIKARTEVVLARNEAERLYYKLINRL